MSVNAKMTAIADAIRAKTGGTASLSLDQMAAEIAGITTGNGSGGNGEFEFVTGTHAVYTKIVTVGPNTVALASEAVEYLQSLVEGTLDTVVLLGDFSGTNNQLLATYHRGVMYRYRDGTVGTAPYANAAYALRLLEGSRYFLISHVYIELA